MRTLLVTSILLIAGSALADSPATTTASTTQKAKAMELADIQALAKKLAAFDVEKKKPGPEDWLANYKETGQSFAEFLKSRPKPQVTDSNTLYIQPIGAFDDKQKKLVEETKEFLGIFFNVRVKALETKGLDVIAEKDKRVHPRWNIPQIKTGAVMNLLLEKPPRDAMATIALTTSDLYPDENWNFVFGEASFNAKVGVWSLYRYGDSAKEYGTVLRRMIKIAAHETGHMLGIYHCTAHECGMNGSNHLDEADAQPMWFCSECDPKIIFACNADATKRYEALAAFAKAHKLEDESKFWEKAKTASK